MKLLVSIDISCREIAMSRRMKNGGYYTPRITFSCSEEQLLKSQKLFQSAGMRGDALLMFLDWLMAKMEKQGESAAALIAYSGKGFAASIAEVENRG